MLTKEELLRLIASNESVRVEKTVSTTDKDKFGEAVCAFANDMADTGRPGYLLVGVRDDGSLSGLKATDDLLKKFAAIRSDGNVLPVPTLAVESFSFDDGDVIVVEVQPSDQPPVRYRGRTWIRLGPRRDIATLAEETALAERKARHFTTFDARPCTGATLADLDMDRFGHDYLPKAVAPDILATDDRPIERQMEALHLYNSAYGCPTYAAVLLFGREPTFFLPGAYIQYVQFDGFDNAATIVNEHAFKGGLCEVLPKIDTFIETAVARKRPVHVSALREETVFEYPKWSVRELVMNAVMHRDYEGNAPIKFYQYRDRLEIQNHGGLYGRARPENFPNVSDYRNPIVAEAMRVLGYVNRYNRGIATLQKELAANGNGHAEFSFRLITAFEAKVSVSGGKAADVAPKDGHFAPKPGDFAAKTAVVAAKDGHFAAKTGDFAPKPSDFAAKTAVVAAKTGELAAKHDAVDKALRVALSDIIKSKRYSVRDAIFSKCRHVYFAMKGEAAISSRALAGKLEMSPRSVSKYQALLVQAGLLTHIGPKNGGEWKFSI